jgi:hypothetical protein
VHQASYGETSGFAPVACDESQAVNGGSPSATVIIGGIAAGNPFVCVGGLVVAGIVICLTAAKSSK